MENNTILILGVGNTICGDEGLGVHAVMALAEEYDFPEHISLHDGGTLGLGLMEMLMDCHKLIVVDAVLIDNAPPGAIYRLTDEQLRESLSFRYSVHQTDLVDTLISCELAGNRPEAVIIGMVPKNWNEISVSFSPEITAAMPAFKQQILDELSAQGGSYTKR